MYTPFRRNTGKLWKSVYQWFWKYSYSREQSRYFDPEAKVRKRIKQSALRAICYWHIEEANDQGRIHADQCVVGLKKRKGWLRKGILHSWCTVSRIIWKRCSFLLWFCIVSILSQERIQQSLKFIAIKSCSTRTFIIINVPCAYSHM